jgi:hypothetical protein
MKRNPAGSHKDWTWDTKERKELRITPRFHLSNWAGVTFH